MSLGNKPYYPVVEKFLESIDEEEVKTLCLVAITGEDRSGKTARIWCDGQWESIMAAAGILQAEATRIYLKETAGEDNTETE